MKIGVGLPNPIPGTQGRLMVEWARAAEELGFSSLATIDRVAYPSYESLIALAAAGAVTQKIGLLTNILLGPTRNPVLLAKEAASVDQISGGRLTLGVGVGSRPDDYEAAGQDYKGRGKRWDEALELMHKAWAGEPVGGSSKPVCPTPVNGSRVPILIGGMSPAAVERTVRWGVGWTAGGAPAAHTLPIVEMIRKAWKEGGREGEPRLVALAYYALGDNAQERAAHYLTDYYGNWGGGIAQATPKTPEALRETARQYKDAGFDELFFDPTIAELDQLHGLADAVLSRS